MKPRIAFREAATAKSGDLELRAKILKATQTYTVQVDREKYRQFVHWDHARRVAAGIKDEALADLPRLLVEFEERIGRRGAKVVWVEDAGEARQAVAPFAEAG